jgi:hypothetical protein
VPQLVRPLTAHAEDIGHVADAEVAALDHPQDLQRLGHGGWTIAVLAPIGLRALDHLNDGGIALGTRSWLREVREQKKSLDALPPGPSAAERQRAHRRRQAVASRVADVVLTTAAAFALSEQGGDPGDIEIRLDRVIDNLWEISGRDAAVMRMAFADPRIRALRVSAMGSRRRPAPKADYDGMRFVFILRMLYQKRRDLLPPTDAPVG